MSSGSRVAVYAIIVVIAVCIAASLLLVQHHKSPGVASATSSLSPSASSTSAQTVSTVSTSTSTSVASGGYVSVVDARGVVVKIRVPVEKVVSEYGLAPPFLYALGVGDKFVCGRTFGVDFYKLIDPTLANKSLGRVSVEDVVKIKPQLVLAAYWMTSFRDLKEMESLGIPVLYLNLESIDGIYHTIMVLSKIFGVQDRGRELINYYNNSLREIESRLAGVEYKPRVLIVYYSGKEHALRTFGGDMFQSKLVELAGGVVVTSGLKGKKTISDEDIVKWNPDVIVIEQYWTSGYSVKKMILSDPALSSVKAVVYGRVYVSPYDGENWIDPSPKWILGLYWLAEVLHPYRMSGVNLYSIAGSFYKEFFNISISRVNLTGDLNVTVRVKDFAGREVVVKEPVERIVTPYPLAAQMIYLLGRGDLIVGGWKRVMLNNLTLTIDPNATERIVDVGPPWNPSVEGIVKLKPQVVFRAYRGVVDKVSMKLESLGVPVVYVSMENVTSFYKTLNIMSVLLGAQERASEVVSFYKNLTSMIEDSLENISYKPKVLFLVYRFKGESYLTPGSGMFQNQLARLAGGVSVSENMTGGWKTISFEEAAKLDPDVIVVISYSTIKPSNIVKMELMKDPLWSKLRAVREGRVYAMPMVGGVSWDYPGPQWILGLCWLSAKLHPKELSWLNITRVAEEYYRMFYGVSLENLTIAGDLG